MSGTQKSWPPPPDGPGHRDTPPEPRISIWLQVVLGLTAGIGFGLVLQFSVFLLGYGRSVAGALLPLGLGLFIGLVLAARAWRRHRAFAVMFMVPIAVVAIVDALEAIALVVQHTPAG